MRSISVLAMAAMVATILTAPIARAGDLREVFSKHSAGSTAVVDHSVWDALLKVHVRVGKDGLNRVDYAGFKRDGRAQLQSYLKRLQAVDLAALDRPEQMAYWINLYNALTIEVVLDPYPVDSIRDIDISPGLFSNGPWGKKLVTVKGVSLSLDDIEHEILRKVWRDARIHYGVNCASIGCPNLSTDAFTGAAIDAQLTAAAKAYVNNPRGVHFDNGRVVVSKIYRWFVEDFDGDAAGVLRHLQAYAQPALAARLKQSGRIDSYAYDWAINDLNAPAVHAEMRGG